MPSEAIPFETALRRVGELLGAEGEEFVLVIMGGAALNLLGIVSRPTSDVDVLGVVDSPPQTGLELREAPRPWPPALRRAVGEVARDMNLPNDWLSAEFRLGWREALPQGLLDRVEWRVYGGLRIGIVSRRDLIFFKLHAAVDREPLSVDPNERPRVDVRDLLALAPTEEELEAATEWTLTQDAGDRFPELVARIVDYVRRNAR